MKPEKNTIIFTLCHLEKEFQVQTGKNKYGSLMGLISEYLPVSGFGICYGGGSCGTCGVEIHEAGTGERRFILSCEIAIDEELANKKVTLLREP